MSYGRTNVQFRFEAGTTPNCFVAESMDVDRFWKVMLEAYEVCVPKL